jgi:hypothetical protein
MLSHELSTTFVGLGSLLNREVGFMSCTQNSCPFVLKVKGFVGSMNEWFSLHVNGPALSFCLSFKLTGGCHVWKWHISSTDMAPFYRNFCM